MKKKIKTAVSLLTVMAVLLTGCGSKSQEKISDDGKSGEVTQEEKSGAITEEDKAERQKVAGEEKAALKTDFSVNMDDIETKFIEAGEAVHDPSILEVDGTYYIYGSHMTSAKSTDLRTWQYLYRGAPADNPIYGKIYTSKDGALSFTGSKESVVPASGTSIWAPDVKYSEKRGLYYMYFCTSSNYFTSTVCYATSPSPEGPFEWQGNLIYSGFNKSTMDKTNVLEVVDEDYAVNTYMQSEGITYNNNKYPNALDPTIFWDKDGKMWMTYGSWSGGIFLLEIDEETGKVIHPKADPENDVDPYFGKKLLGGGHVSIEAPYILYDKEADYYYLYVSYGGLEQKKGYQIRVFRSKTPDGNYEDMNGEHPEQGAGSHANFGLKLSGNYRLPSLDQAYMATGHNSAFIDKDGKRYIVCHTRFERRGEQHQPRVHQYLLNEEGWPCMLPYATEGEAVAEKGYEKSKVVGEYYMVNQGTKIGSEIAEPVKIVLTEGGNVFGKDVEGMWKAKDGSYQVHITLDGKDYSGVFCEMNDEAGKKVMTFSAVGENESIWGVKY